FEGVCLHRFLVAIAGGKHPFPSRTRSLRPPAPRVLLLLRSGRAGRRQDLFNRPSALWQGACCHAGLPGRRSGGKVILLGSRDRTGGNGMQTVTTSHIWLADDGRAWIDDTNTKVIEVVYDYVGGWNAEEIHEQYPYLSLAQI